MPAIRKIYPSYAKSFVIEDIKILRASSWIFTGVSSLGGSGGGAYTIYGLFLILFIYTYTLLYSHIFI